MKRMQILGRGWGLPVRPDDTTRQLPFAEGEEKVRQSLWLILDTEPGERIMRPAFGCGLRRYLMRPNSVATRALIRHDVESAITTWEPRIKLSEVQVEPGDDSDSSLVLIRLSYRHRCDSSPSNLVYPLYLDRR